MPSHLATGSAVNPNPKFGQGPIGARLLAIKTKQIKHRKQEDLKMDKTYACKIIGSIVYGSKKKKNRSFRETTFITQNCENKLIESVHK